MVLIILSCDFVGSDVQKSSKHRTKDCQWYPLSKVNGTVKWYCINCIRGESFRSILFQLGELRSIIPEKINVMALTATIKHFYCILNPYKPNITYLISKYKTLSETFAPLLRRLRDKRTICPSTIIYCHRLEDCANLYLYFKSEIGESFTEPYGAPCQLSNYRLVDMFTSYTDITKSLLVTLAA